MGLSIYSLKFYSFTHHGIQCQTFMLLYIAVNKCIPLPQSLQSNPNTLSCRQRQCPKMASSQFSTTQISSHFSFHLALINPNLWVNILTPEDGRTVMTREELLHPYLFQRFQPCLPPCRSLLCLECPLFCWRQFPVIVFIRQESLGMESQSEPHNISNVHKRSFTEILFFSDAPVTSPLTARLDAEVFNVMCQVKWRNRKHMIFPSNILS
jgi:hypothetical protein